jgi:hypothetical protein
MTEIPGIIDVSKNIDQKHIPRLWDGDITVIFAQFPTLQVRAYGAAELRFYSISMQGNYAELNKRNGSLDGLSVYVEESADHIQRSMINQRWKKEGVKKKKGRAPVREVHAHEALEETVYLMTNRLPILDKGSPIGNGGGYHGDLYEILSKEHLGRRKLRR